jgi:hypothetical protein
MWNRRVAIALAAVAASVAGCGEDGPSSQDRIERVERRYEKLWNAESVSCREAAGGEGYECRVVSKQRQPGDPRTSYDFKSEP